MKLVKNSQVLMNAHLVSAQLPDEMPTSRDLSARCPTGLLPNRRRLGCSSLYLLSTENASTRHSSNNPRFWVRSASGSCAHSLHPAARGWGAAFPPPENGQQCYRSPRKTPRTYRAARTRSVRRDSVYRVPRVSEAHRRYWPTSVGWLRSGEGCRSFHCRRRCRRGETSRAHRRRSPRRGLLSLCLPYL